MRLNAFLARAGAASRRAGLFGKKRVWICGIFHLTGIRGEHPFVGKLRRAESAQHSVHWTLGILQVFWSWFWTMEVSRFVSCFSPAAGTLTVGPTTS
jgi:hypothetical protein